MYMDEENKVEETETGEVAEVAEEVSETAGDAVEEAAPAVEEAPVEGVLDERPEASSIEEARDSAFKVSEGNPYAPKAADGQ